MHSSLPDGKSGREIKRTVVRCAFCLCNEFGAGLVVTCRKKCSCSTPIAQPRVPNGFGFLVLLGANSQLVSLLCSRQFSPLFKKLDLKSRRSIFHLANSPASLLRIPAWCQPFISGRLDRGFARSRRTDGRRYRATNKFYRAKSTVPDRPTATNPD